MQMVSHYYLVAREWRSSKGSPPVAVEWSHFRSSETNCSSPCDPPGRGGRLDWDNFGQHHWPLGKSSSGTGQEQKVWAMKWASSDWSHRAVISWHGSRVSASCPIPGVGGQRGSAAKMGMNVLILLVLWRWHTSYFYRCGETLWRRWTGLRGSDRDSTFIEKTRSRLK